MHLNLTDNSWLVSDILVYKCDTVNFSLESANLIIRLGYILSLTLFLHLFYLNGDFILEYLQLQRGRYDNAKKNGHDYTGSTTRKLHQTYSGFAIRIHGIHNESIEVEYQEAPKETEQCCNKAIVKYRIECIATRHPCHEGSEENGATNASKFGMVCWTSAKHLSVGSCTYP